ncbi:MAG: hypothetical protein A2149_05995 [Candidatus Schekmanbacteria bacterium RBG_16_38_11]|uniref:DUF8201 domain-containing protein n=1 Tax=Candidatus Schekmanbacteria bacterium RBG_16_38_11 TaxID=1817880 RepID=A0A1F7RWM5_9BACT|nr:MAG: hypothetical protein A2149_05995 [Candidatus Schekmanbacteria bacterium RBG_16_38_11]
MDIIYKISFILGSLSVLIFLLGSFKTFSIPYIIFLTILGLVAIFYVTLSPFLSRKSSQKCTKTETFKSTSSTPLHNTNWQCLGLYLILLTFIFAILPLVLTPPTSRDELIHHLAIPKLYLEKGKIFEIPFMSFSYFPMNIDLLYLIPLSLGNDIMPKIIHLIFAVLTGAALYLYLFPLAGKKYALLGFLLYFSTPLVVNLARSAYTDLGMNFYSTLALIGVLKWRQEGFKKKWLFYSAISTGFALSSKPSAIPVLILFFFAVLYFYSKDTKKEVEALKHGAIFLLIIFLIISPWLIRNYLWAGNPLYPLYGWYKVHEGIESSNTGYISGGIYPLQKRHLLYNEGAISILLIPLRIFIEGEDDSPQHFDGVLNPFFLLFLIFAFLKKPKIEVKYLAIFSILFFCVTFFIVHLAVRYLLPIIPALIIIMIWGIKNGFETRQFKTITIIFSILLFTFNIVYTIGLYQKDNPLPYLLGKETRKEYLLRLLPDYPAINFANNSLPAVAKVMLIFTGDRGYYWKREYYFGSRDGASLVRFVEESRSEKELLQRVKALGITHLFIKNSLFLRFLQDNFKTEKLRLINSFFRTKLSLLYNDNNYSIFRIKNP